MIVRKKRKQLYNLRAININVILRCQRHTYFKNYIVSHTQKILLNSIAHPKNSNGGRGQIGGKGWIRVN